MKKALKSIKKRKRPRKHKSREMGKEKDTSLLSKAILYSIIVAFKHFPRTEAIVAKKSFT